jgi:xyloglucan-specific exo-beta-1,4-glucanase
MRTPRISRRGLLAAGAAGAAAVATGGIATPAQARGAQGGRERYAWGNVEIVGGGFVPGIVFNLSEPGLVYARTDIGGAYRWSQRGGRWIPLLDWVGWDSWGYTGVASLATDLHQ